jgi:glycosyltransferase involved in cell wall biosynthesis
LNFKVLHVHDVWVLPAAILANIFGRKKVVYDAHEYIRGLEIFSRKKLSGVIWKFTEYILIKKIDCLISINEDHQKLFREHYPKIPKSVVLKNYPRLQQMGSSRGKSAISAREKVIIFQGILKRGRGLLQAIEAMQNLQSGTLRIIGYGEIKDELEKKVKHNHIKEKVEFLGKVQLADLLAETKKARAGLVLFEPLSLNYTYASPNKFFEYVMSGTPIIASNIPTFQALNQEFEVALLVDPFKPESISRAMDRLLTDDKLWLRLHQNCLMAGKSWNWEAQENRLMELYENLLNS